MDVGEIVFCQKCCKSLENSHYISVWTMVCLHWIAKNRYLCYPHNRTQELLVSELDKRGFLKTLDIDNMIVVKPAWYLEEPSLNFFFCTGKH